METLNALDFILDYFSELFLGMSLAEVLIGLFVITIIAVFVIKRIANRNTKPPQK